MKAIFFQIIFLFSLDVLADFTLEPFQVFEDPQWGVTEVYDLSFFEYSGSDHYWLNKATVAQQALAQNDGLDDRRWSHDHNLGNDVCSYAEYANPNKDSEKFAFPENTKFSMEGAPYVIRHPEQSELDKLHFFFEATYWGNPSEIVGKKLYVTCKVDLSKLPLDDIASFIENLIEPSLRNSK